MQDNRSQREFEDQAWEAMQAMLDKEMPVGVVPRQERRKRWLLLLLFLLIGFGGAASFAIGFWPEEQISLPGTIEQRKVPESNVPIASTEQNILEEVNVGSVEKGNNTSHSGLNNKSSSKSISTKPISGFTQISNKKEFKKSTHADDLSSSGIVPKTENTFTSVAENAQPKPAEELAIPGFLPVADQVATKTFSVNNESSFDWNESTLAIQLDQSGTSGMAYQGLNLEAGVFSHQLENIDGALARAMVDFRFGRSAFGLSTGVGYRLATYEVPASATERPINQTLSRVATQGGTFSNDNSVFEAFTPDLVEQLESASLNGFQASVSVPSGIGKRHYLTLPVWLTYQPMTKLQLEGGVELAYLLGYNQSDDYAQALSDEQSPITNSGSDPGSMFDKSASDNMAQELERFQLLFETGITYHPIQQIGLRMHYLHQLTPVFKNAEANELLPKHQFQLSVQFRF